MQRYWWSSAFVLYLLRVKKDYILLVRAKRTVNHSRLLLSSVRLPIKPVQMHLSSYSPN